MFFCVSHSHVLLGIDPHDIPFRSFWAFISSAEHLTFGRGKTIVCFALLKTHVCWPNVRLVKSIFIIFIFIFWLLKFPAILGSWFHAPAWDFPRFAAFWAVVSGSHRKLNYREPFGRLQGSWQPWNARSPWKKGSGRWWFWLASFFAGICKVMGWKMMVSGMSSMSRWKMLNLWISVGILLEFQQFLLPDGWSWNHLTHGGSVLIQRKRLQAFRCTGDRHVQY